MSSSATYEDYFCLHKKFLIFNLVMRNLKIRYRKSLLGMLWTVLIPAGTAVIYYFVFYFVLKVKMPNYLLFILSGLVPWTFFSATIAAGVDSIVGNYQLLNKVPLPPQALPLSEVFTNLLNLLLSLPVIAAVMLLFWVAPTLAIIQYLILLALLFFITYAFALTLGIMFVYFRDLRYIVALVIQFWFYLTPVMYSAEMIPEQYRFALYLNPIGLIFTGFHSAIVGGTWLTLKEWGIVLAWTACLILVSKLVLSRFRSSLVEVL